jgi:hypothetical protein
MLPRQPIYRDYYTIIETGMQRIFIVTRTEIFFYWRGAGKMGFCGQISTNFSIASLKNDINSDTIFIISWAGGNVAGMDSIDYVIKRLEKSPGNIRFTELCKICNQYFGEPRHQGSSHKVYKTPWQGDPRVNIQDKNGKAKVYQVRQVAKALKRLEVEIGNKKINKK